MKKLYLKTVLVPVFIFAATTFAGAQEKLIQVFKGGQAVYSEKVVSVDSILFVAGGTLSAATDAIHLPFKEDTVDISQVFSKSAEVGTISLEIVQPQKKETGFGTGEWVTVPGVYKFSDDLQSVISVEGLPASWNLPAIVPQSREVKSGYLRAKYLINGAVVDTKDVELVQDSISPEIIKIIPSDERMRVALFGDTLAVGNGFTGTTNLAITKSKFQVTYSNGTGRSANDGYDADYNSVKYTTLEAENKNGSTVGVGTGSPISHRANYPEQFYINLAATTPVLGDIGYISLYPYGTDKNDWRTLKLTVITVEPVGIVARPQETYSGGIPGQLFHAGNAAAVQGNHHAYTTLSLGPPVPYDYAEWGFTAALGSVLVVADSWNTYNGSPVIEGYISTPAAKNNSLLKSGQTDNTVAANYAGFYQVNLTAAGLEAPAGTPVTFKLCPKNHFLADGTPDPAWTVDVTTQIYAN